MKRKSNGNFKLCEYLAVRISEIFTKVINRKLTKKSLLCYNMNSKGGKMSNIQDMLWFSLGKKLALVEYES